MALSFAQLGTLILEKLHKLTGQLVYPQDVEDVATATVNFVTNDGNSLPPYVKPNSTVGRIPYLSNTYQLGNSPLSYFSGLGGGIQLAGGWRLDTNVLKKVELFQPTAHATNRYETLLTLPKGGYDKVTLSVKVYGLGNTSGLIHKIFTFDANTSGGATSVVLTAQDDVPTKVYLGEPDWSGLNIIIPLYERSAVNAAKLYVVEVEVMAGATFMTALLTQSALLTAVTTTARSAGSLNTANQMSLTSDSAGLKLVNDVTSPGTLMFYGTNAAGTRNWLAQTSVLQITFNRQTASYTLVLADAFRTVEMNVASANNLTIPLNSSVAFAIGTQIIIAQYGAGQTTIVATGGVNIRSNTSKVKLSARYSAATLVKVGTDEWYLWGDLTA